MAFKGMWLNFIEINFASLEQFQFNFGELIAEYVGVSGRQLVVFIDNLDRCLPEKSVLLEAVEPLFGCTKLRVRHWC